MPWPVPPPRDVCAPPHDAPEAGGNPRWRLSTHVLTYCTAPRRSAAGTVQWMVPPLRMSGEGMLHEARRAEARHRRAAELTGPVAGRSSVERPHHLDLVPLDVDGVLARDRDRLPRHDLRPPRLDLPRGYRSLVSNYRSLTDPCQARAGHQPGLGEDGDGKIRRLAPAHQASWTSCVCCSCVTVTPGPKKGGPATTGSVPSTPGGGARPGIWWTSSSPCSRPASSRARTRVVSRPWS